MATITVTTLSDVTDAADGATTLREAVAEAQTLAGADDIVFDSGLSGEIVLTQGEIDILSDVTIDGDADGDGFGDISINGSGGRIFDIISFGPFGGASTASLNGLTFQGIGSDAANPDQGGAIKIATTTVTITNSVFDQLASTIEGGAIASLNASVTIEDSMFTGNQSGKGGAIYVDGGSLSLLNTDISDGSANQGGGVYVNEATSVSIAGGAFSNNQGADSGGGVHLWDFTNAYINGATFTGNNDNGGSGVGGAIYAVIGNLDIVDTTISGNSSGNEGGGVWYEHSSSTLTITNSVIEQNSSGDGAGIKVDNGTLVLQQSEVSGNTGTGDGAGIQFQGASLTIEDTLIDGNTTGLSATNGGGVYIRASTATLTNTTVTNNAAAYGGGIYADDQNVYLNNVTITANQAVYGGGFSGRADTEISDSIILGNSSNDAEFNEVDISSSTDFLGLNIVGSDAATFDASAEANVENAAADNVFDVTATVNGVLAGVLADNGGPVETVALQDNQFNIALDASAGSSIPSDDARGTAAFNQVGLGAESGDGIRDLGAYELDTQVTVTPPETPSLIVTIAGDIVDEFDNETSLREAVAFANSDLDQSDITFDAGLKGSTLTVTQGVLEIASDVSMDGDIDGDGDRDITLDGGGTQGIISVINADANYNASDSSIAVNGMILQNGNGGTGGGGAIDSGAYGVTITNSRFVDNVGGAYGGAVNFRGSPGYTGEMLLIQNSEFEGNRNILFNGGAVGSQDGDILVENSRFIDNTAVAGGGAVTAGFAAAIVIRDSYFSGNMGENGPGGAVVDGTSSGLTVERSSFVNNSTIGDGGAIATFGAGGQITDSTFTDNSSTGKGGAVSTGFGGMTLTNVTMEGNGAQYGGGISVSNGALDMSNSTLTSNQSYFGGGAIYDSTATGTVSDSIILGNVGDTFISSQYNAFSNGSGFTFAGLNLIGVNGGAFDAASAGASVENAAVADVFATTAAFYGAYQGGVAADNGGGLETVSLLVDAANPALDASGGAAIPGADARGVAAFDQAGVGAESGAGVRDLGAFELTDIATPPETPSLVVTILDDVVDEFDNETSLREAIAFANSNPDQSDITFEAGLSGTLSLTNGQLETTTLVSIDGDTDGDDKADVTIDAGGASRILEFSDDLSIYSLTFANGDATFEASFNDRRGGALASFTEADLTVAHSTFSGGAAIIGGGIYVLSGATTVSDSTFVGNSVTAQGGAIAQPGSGSLDLSNLTFVGNTAGLASNAIHNPGAALMTLVNSTFTGTQSAGGSAREFTTSSLATVNNNIFAGDVTSSPTANIPVTQLIQTNIVAGVNQFFGLAGADVFASVDANDAGVLADNGGPVQTVALLKDADNPAIDSSSAATATAADARGVAAFDVSGFGADSGAGVRDFGAYELEIDPTLTGTTGDDSLEGTPFVDEIFGGDGNDTINGRRGGDSLFGGAGDDTIDAGPGVDEVYGGDDNDLIFGGAGRDLLLFGGAGDDTVYGRGGGDSIHGDAGNDMLFGGVSNDKIFGGADDDTALGGEGNDDLFGGDGVDDLSGGAGNDDLFGGDGADMLAGNDGNDRIFGGLGDDTATGGEGNDTLEGGDGADSLSGGIGDDVLFGGDQFDTLDGNDGLDTLYGGAGKDDLSGGAGEDLIYGGAGKDVILGGGEADEIFGDGGRDDISGGAGDDMLFGGAENDVIAGNDGADTLSGGTGDDRLTGGADADVFRFEDGFGADEITDFAQGSDVIDLQNVTGVSAFGDLTITANGANVDITLAGATDMITVNGAVGDFDGSDFLFLP